MRRLCKGVHVRANCVFSVLIVRLALQDFRGLGTCRVFCGCVVVQCTPDELSRAQAIVHNGTLLSPDAPQYLAGAGWLHICLEEGVLI